MQLKKESTKLMEKGVGRCWMLFNIIISCVVWVHKQSHPL